MAVGQHVRVLVRDVAKAQSLLVSGGQGAGDTRAQRAQGRRGGVCGNRPEHAGEVGERVKREAGQVKLAGGTGEGCCWRQGSMCGRWLKTW